MYLTNLEKGLRNDVGGRYKDEVLARLLQWREEMGRELMRADSFERFNRNLVLRRGCVAAIRVVESLAVRLQ